MARKPRTKQERYRLTHPWVAMVCDSRRRVNDKKSKWQKWYAGIPHTITAADVQEIWIRDGADKMKRPSLDRIDGPKGYVRGNIRIIEFNANARMAWDESFKFLYDRGEAA